MSPNFQKILKPPKHRTKWANLTLFLLCLFKTASLYFMFQQQFHFTPRTSCILAIVLGALFTALSCASLGFQCLTLLMVPQMLSKRGRTALIAYVFVLAISGPARNAVNNSEVMFQSLNCAQAQLKVSMHETLTAIKIPFAAIKEVIQKVVSMVEKGFLEIQRVLGEILKRVRSVLATIRAGYRWLVDLVSICNRGGQTPYERCITALETSVSDCKWKLPILGFLCNVQHVAKPICYSVKPVDKICDMISFINDAVFDAVEEKLQLFIDDMDAMFHVTVNFDHGYYYNMNISKTFEEIAGDISHEVQNQPIFKIFSILGIISSMCMLFVIFRSIQYKRNYLTMDSYDNCYIGREFYTIDKRRESMDLPRALPLTRREENCYITLTSMCLLRHERLRIARNAFFLFISTLQIVGIVGADYYLYRILVLIRRACLKQSTIELPGLVKIHVTGTGTIADMYRHIVTIIEAIARGADYLQPANCAPDPKIPDFVKYWLIAFLVTSTWIFMILEPYGLRVRQLIMAGYYPERAQERATWLYNEILLKRESFEKLVLKQLASDLEDPTPTPTMLDFIRRKTNRFWISRVILGSHQPVRCVLCASDLAVDEKVRCLRPRCAGVYCYECFLEIKNVCWMCGDPISTGDSSDESIERDSSDED